MCCSSGLSLLTALRVFWLKGAALAEGAVDGLVAGLAAAEALVLLEEALPLFGSEAGEAVLLPHPARAAEPRRANKAKPAEANERATARGSKEKASRRRSA